MSIWASAYKSKTSHCPRGGDKKITALHLTNWPDKEVISIPQLSCLVTEIREAQAASKTGKLCMHCVAGVGRTGSVFAALALKQMHEDGNLTRENLDDAVIKVIAEGRASRGQSFVQTAEQLRLVRGYAESLVDGNG